MKKECELVSTDGTHLSATPRWSDSSLETPWREGAEQLRYAPPLWFCTEYYGIGRSKLLSQLALTSGPKDRIPATCHSTFQENTSP
ncbi:hypothetical protein TNCV_2673571 [Trichonephila clavipes]|nr:hypothetical protein TNCV_2673571 [Trichonephila clavipes]